MNLNLDRVNMDRLVIHRVGNKSKSERNYLSDGLFMPGERMRDTLLSYFTKPFKRLTEWYQFDHEGGLDMHPMYGFCKTIFENNENLLPESRNIAEHLYRQSTHPNIKAGELIVTVIRDFLIDDELVDAIGIFKCERKQRFFQLNQENEDFSLSLLEGISAEKLDKGCLIFNVSGADGYRLLSLDNNLYDSRYWLFSFLNVDFVRDFNYHTRSYLDLCEQFSDELVNEGGDRHDKMKFIADSMDYFAQKDHFDAAEFTTEVTDKPEVAQAWRNFQSERLPEAESFFPISTPVLKSAQKMLRSNIKLDTNMIIKLDLRDPNVNEHYLERGYDEEKGMYFYKLYFNEET